MRATRIPPWLARRGLSATVKARIARNPGEAARSSHAQSDADPEEAGAAPAGPGNVVDLASQRPREPGRVASRTAVPLALRAVRKAAT